MLPELLTNGGFEEDYKHVTPAWSQNTWAAKGENAHSGVVFSRDGTGAHGGTAAQQVAINDLASGSGTILFQNFDFAAGRVYEGRVWLRAERAMNVRVEFRKRSFFYNTGAAQKLAVGTAWQEVVIRGGYHTPMPGQFAIVPLEPGVLHIDDASLKDITAQVVDEEIANTDPIPSTFFGTHINKLGVHNTWPAVHFGTLRLWDTATNWASVEATRGAAREEANWKTGAPGFRLAYYLGHVKKHDPACQVIYTMGVTPLWAAPGAKPGYYSGTASPPANLDDWREYVRAVGRRFSDRVRYWELWNEADIGQHYRGDITTMCELARIAQEELKAIRPDNQILSPNITSIGVGFLDNFLQAGGGRYVDIISWHHYAPLRPEDSLPTIEAVRHVMRRHGIDKPLWNTEGKPGGDPGTPGDEGAKEPMPDDIARAAVARTHLVQWAYGVRVFCWYMFDEGAERACIHLSRSTEGAAKPDFALLTPAGETYNELTRWLVGARMISKSVVDSPTGGQRWAIQIERENGYQGSILWDTQALSHFLVPAKWDVRRIRRLDGSSAAAIPTDRRVSVGPLPILLDNQAP